MVSCPDLLGNEGFLGTRDFHAVDGRIILTRCFIIKRDLFGQKEEVQPSGYDMASDVHTLTGVPEWGYL